MMARHLSAVSVLFVVLGPTALLAQLQESVPPVPLRSLEEAIPGGPAVPTLLRLSLEDAISRAIGNNLAMITSSENERRAAALRQKELTGWFPRIDLTLASVQQQVNLAAFGFSGFPGVPAIIGPFSLVDARAALSQPVVDLERHHRLLGATENERAAAFSRVDTRERVVLTVVDLYFRAVSAASRVAASEAQVARARLLHERAADMKEAGVIAGIDVLRAEVELSLEEQRLIQARNRMLQQKLTLARAIGLSLEQEFALSDELPEAELPPVSLPALLEQARASRADARALEARIRAAEEAVDAHRARRLPTFNLRGDYGSIGRTPGSTHGTYSLRAEIRVPVFDREISAEAGEAEAILRRRRAERQSLAGRIEFEVRSALLDVQSAQERLSVAKRSLTLARHQLDQAQDRFTAGVANNLEVVQAQEAVAVGDEGVIQSLYEFQFALALLARATGTMEQSARRLFRSPPP